MADHLACGIVKVCFQDPNLIGSVAGFRFSHNQSSNVGLPFEIRVTSAVPNGVDRHAGDGAKAVRDCRHNGSTSWRRQFKLDIGRRNRDPFQ